MSVVLSQEVDLCFLSTLCSKMCMLCVHVFVYVEHMCSLSHRLLLQLAILDMLQFEDNVKLIQFEHKLHID